nr:MAG TPA: hypothetical protein [Caudoviricetes sp.]
MAEYKVVVDPVSDTIIKTLSFNGKEYTELWVENNTHCDCVLEALVERDYPNMDIHIWNLIEEITSMDEGELLEALGELTEYERLDL